MKKLALILASGVLMTACATTKQAPEEQAIGMSNPASDFCVANGGTLEPKRNADGEYALCHLPNGTVVEEWEFYRKNSK